MANHVEPGYDREKLQRIGLVVSGLAAGPNLLPFSLDGVEPRLDLGHLLNGWESLLERIDFRVHGVNPGIHGVEPGIDGIEPGIDSVETDVHGREFRVHHFLQLADLLFDYRPYLGLKSRNAEELSITF
jgi:hypothetical protein